MNIWKRNFFLIYVILHCSLTWANDTYRYENFTVKDGLSQNTIRDIIQDHQGFLWIGTLNGINRYDGRTFISMHPQFGLSASLNDSRIKKIIEGKHGLIWILTNSDEVSCYDTQMESFLGFNFSNYHYNKIKQLSNGDVWLLGDQNGCTRITFSNRQLEVTNFNDSTFGTKSINFIHESIHNTILVGTKKGLWAYREYKWTAVASLKNLDVSHIEESYNLLFAFTNNNKVFVIHPETLEVLETINFPTSDNLVLNNTFKLNLDHLLITTQKDCYILNTKSKKIKLANELFGGKTPQKAFTLIDNKHHCWIYNKTGKMWQYKNDVNRFDEMTLIPPSIMSVIDLERYTVYHDSRNIIWITTYGNGLFSLDQNTGKTSHMVQEFNKSGISSNYLLSCTEDNSGEMWIGTEHAGITKISLMNYKNTIYYPEPRTSGNNSVRLIYEDQMNHLWIGTKSGNIHVVDESFNKIHTCKIHNGMPYSLCEDKYGNKWVGTKGNGLMIFNNKYENIREKYTLNPIAESLLNNDLYAILRDSKDRMWLGTFGKGLLLAEVHNNQLDIRSFNAISHSHKRIRTLCEDLRGNIWVGSSNGVVVFNPDSLMANDSNFVSFKFDKKDDSSLNNNEIKEIFCDTKGRIWLATSGGGLNLALVQDTLKNTQFKHYTSHSGLINNMVQSIMEDQGGELWISTENGISRFDPITEHFENFNIANAWEGDLFSETTCFKRQNGELMLGSYNGLYHFQPNDLKNSDYSPPVVLTELCINGNAVQPSKSASPLSQSISKTKNIKLNDGQNSFSIQFASLNYTDPQSNRYTFILSGFEHKWNAITKYNIATYRNIPSGKYIFRVKGCNSFGIWNDTETTLNIEVVAPFWKSTQAILCYILLVLALLYFAIKVILKINRLNNLVEVENQLTEYRIQFFTNISHEFRTPLTIIRGTIDNLLERKNLDESIKQDITILGKSSNRLMRLIDQLLEFRRLQNNKMELNLEFTNAIPFFHDIYNVFTEIAQKKNITFKFEAPSEALIIPLDKSKMDKITCNLLSNAFKHTPENGVIFMKLSTQPSKNQFTLDISDSGTGIDNDKQAGLFVRFNQVNYSASGTGIGLHLTSELTAVHKGTIHYLPSIYGGACFSVTLPLTDACYELDDFTNHQFTHASTQVETSPLFDIENDRIEPSTDVFPHKVLIIEDNHDVLNFLRKQFQKQFSVITAENGAIGLEVASNFQPDLIICDIMMPEMDGFEVIRRLKSNFQTSHIPIIILTAHFSEKHKVEGIEAGADAYITKPFSTQYLLTRARKLMEQREELRKHYEQEPGILPPQLPTNNRDKEFISKIHTIIEENLDNAHFTVIDFANLAGFGKTVFYKKMKGITGHSPNEYLKTMRMKKAAELLSESDLNVSEVSYKVGINDPFYFSRCFKAQFGKSPSSFKNLH